MLNKNACKQCYDRMFDDKHVKYNDPVLWGEKEEGDWESGFIICLWSHGVVLTNQKPPKKCPYFLEQLMSGDESC